MQLIKCNRSSNYHLVPEKMKGNFKSDFGVLDVTGPCALHSSVITAWPENSMRQVKGTENFEVLDGERLTRMIQSLSKMYVAPPSHRPTMVDGTKATKGLELREKLKTLKNALESTEAEENRLQRKLVLEKRKATEKRAVVSDRIKGLTQKIKEVEFQVGNATRKHALMVRNSLEVVQRMKAALGDAPEDDREELEDECVWEVNTAIQRMEMMRKDLVVKHRVVRGARHLICKKARGKGRLIRWLALGENGAGLIDGFEVLTRFRLASRIRPRTVALSSDTKAPRELVHAYLS